LPLCIEGRNIVDSKTYPRKPPIRELCTETGGAPKFPSYPSEDMPRSQTPVVSCALAIPHPGLLPSGACKPSAFAAIPLRLSCCPRLYIFRGSITRPASSRTPASYAHCWAGTWRSLLTCWRGVSQVGLEPESSHPLGNNTQFHRISPTPKVSGLPWREHAVIGIPGSSLTYFLGQRTRSCLRV
jgi:hypothetical protein